MQKVIIILFLFCSILFSQEVAIVKSLKGTVQVKRDNQTITLSLGSMLHNGDIIMTQSDSSVGIIFDDGSTMALGSKSIFSINRFVVDPVQQEFNVDLNLSEGSASFESGEIGQQDPESFKFHIPEGIIGIRGTKFYVEVD